MLVGHRLLKVLTVFLVPLPAVAGVNWMRGGAIQAPPAAVLAPVHASSAAVGADDGGQRLAWLIWGRRGKSRRVSRQAVSWPAGRKWPADAETVNHWGKILLAAGENAPEAKAADLLIFPRAELALSLDGALMNTEWDLRAARRVPTPAGPMLVLGKWQDQGLAIAVGLPWVVSLSPRTQVVVTLGPQASDAVGLPKSVRAYRIDWDARQHRSVLWVGLPAGRRWRWREVSEEDINQRKGFRGGINELGDGGVPFVAAEFLIPLSGEMAPAGGAKELTGAIFVAHLPTEAEGRDAVMWPPAHSRGYPRTESLLLEHPDGWGHLASSDDTAERNDCVLRQLTSAPHIDGRVAEEEWAGADRRVLELATVDGEMFVGAHGARLFLAMRCRPLRQRIAQPTLELYVDSAGDGGLLPRDDDRLVVFTPRGRGGEVLGWEMPRREEKDKVVTSEGDWTRVERRSGEWAWCVEDGNIEVEAAVPLSALGIDMQKLPQRIGFLVRLCYEVSFKLAGSR